MLQTNIICLLYYQRNYLSNSRVREGSMFLWEACNSSDLNTIISFYNISLNNCLRSFYLRVGMINDASWKVYAAYTVIYKGIYSLYPYFMVGKTIVCCASIFRCLMVKGIPNGCGNAPSCVYSKSITNGWETIYHAYTRKV